MLWHRATQRALPNELPWPIKWSYKIGMCSSAKCAAIHVVNYGAFRRLNQSCRMFGGRGRSMAENIRIFPAEQIECGAGIERGEATLGEIAASLAGEQ